MSFTGVDECFANKSKCEQICIDTWDGYNCSCNTGYRIDPADTYRCDGKCSEYYRLGNVFLISTQKWHEAF